MSLTEEQFNEIFKSHQKVQGFTHDFYKYPARFNPKFVRLILEEFSVPGDWVLDPFMGGGTTLVESLASGRCVIGSDINELARFVTSVKTTPLSSRDIVEVRTWAEKVRLRAMANKPVHRLTEAIVRNMPSKVFPFFETANQLVNCLEVRRRRRFAQCALVRVGQWALDARTSTPSVPELCDELEKRVEQMIRGLGEFVASAKKSGTNKNKITSLRQLKAYSAADSRFAYNLGRKEIQPKLVITSPPYPGVHVLYHRWQVLGRRETPAPYWITNLRDGHGGSHYTMGSRSALGVRNYFRNLLASFVNLRRMLSPDAHVVQLVSFSDTDAQLPLYLDTMDATGFREASSGNIQSRQVRLVPNRRWYNYQGQQNDASKEVLLVHQVKY